MHPVAWWMLLRAGYVSVIIIILLSAFSHRLSEARGAGAGWVTPCPDADCGRQTMQLERLRYASQDGRTISQADLLGPAPLPPDFSAIRHAHVAASPAAATLPQQEEPASMVSNGQPHVDTTQAPIMNASPAQDLAAKELILSLKSTESTFIDTLHSLLRRDFANALHPSVDSRAFAAGRNHAGPSATPSTCADTGEHSSEDDKAFQPLLLDLRAACESVEEPFARDNMRQVNTGSRDPLTEIRMRLDRLEPYFPRSTRTTEAPSNAQASKNLASMIAIIRRLQSLYRASPFLASSHKLATPLPTPATEGRFSFDSVEEGSIVSEASQGMYSALQKQAKVLQSASLSRQESHESTNVVRAVEEAEVELLWGRLGDLLDNTMQSFQSQAITRSPNILQRANHEYLFGGTPAMSSEAAVFDIHNGLPEYSSLAPPSYDNEGLEGEGDAYDNVKEHPEEDRLAGERIARTVPTTSIPASDEKMQLDLDRMASAIERLYVSAPQLANQRVDPVLRNGHSRQQVREMQLAKLGTAIERLCKGRLEDQRASLLQTDTNPFASARSKSKRKERDTKQESLDHLLDEIDKASARTLDGQRASMTSKQQTALTGARKTARLAAADFDTDTEAIGFAEYLLESAGKGRLTSQDASFSGDGGLSDIDASKRRSLAYTSYEKALNSENGRSHRMRSSSVGASPALSIPAAFAATADGRHTRPAIKKRFSVTRLLSSNKEPPSVLSASSAKRSCKSNASNSVPASVHESDVARYTYVVEEMTNLGSMVLQIWDTSSHHLDPDVIAEPLSVMLTDSKTAQLTVPEAACQNDNRRLHLTSDAKPSLVGHEALQMIYKADHHEVKIPTAVSTQFTRSRDDLEIAVPYSAQDFRTHQPTSLICTSCAAELANLAEIKRYNDLPSEHWAELLDAWMCHPDQTLSKDIIDKGNNIWPQENQALISTTGIILATANTTGWVIADGMEPVHHSDGKWLVAKCKSCRALVGRSSPGPTRDIHEKSAYVRFSKFAIQPASFMPVSSLASHVTSTLLETSLARAIHRFVIEDEEEGQNQLILWVFNPYIRLVSNHSAFDSSAPVSAAKVLYKAGKLEDADIVRLIGNAEYETLIYPRGICLQLAELLQTSTSIYPRSHQRLGEWDVGWLERDIGRQH